MPADVPAALPLIAFAAGLLIGRAGSGAEIAGFITIGILLVLLRRVRTAMVCLAFAGGIASATHARSVAARNDANVASFAGDRFVTVVAPIDGDWARRGDAYALRCRRFTVNGIAVDDPVTVYVRFAPPPIALERLVVAEGFLRRSDRGDVEVTVKSPRLMRYAGAMPRWHPATWNRALANRLRPFAAMQPDEVALVEALALGRGERLDDEVRDAWKRGGTYHLLVFSGLQIAFAAALIALALRWLRAPRASDWSLLVFAAAAPPFIGPTASVSRAAIGIGVYALTRILHRPTNLENLWCVAALLRLVVAPADLIEPAFQLTYAGAGAMLFVAKAFRRRRVLAAAVAAELTVTPLTLFHFRQYALGGSLTTLALTPLVFAMLLLSVAICACPCLPLLAAIGALHRVCTMLNAAAAPLWGFHAAPPRWAAVVAYTAAMAAIALLAGRRRAAAIAFSMLVPLAAAVAVAHRDVAVPHLTVLDVGQGDSLLLRAPGHAVLIDAGGRMGDRHFGESTLLPMLLDRGVRRIDVAVLTHVHPDHCGGMPAVLAYLDVGAVWISPRRFRGDCAARILEICAAREIPIHLVRDGDAASVGPFALTAFVASRTFKRSPENNASVVLRARTGGWTALLTGDVERDAEAELAERDVRADVLKIAHHGSRTSTTAPLLDAVQPRVALISCGAHNTFGHPHPSVLQALAARGIRTWRTDRGGAIDVEMGEHVVVRQER